MRIAGIDIHPLRDSRVSAGSATPSHQDSMNSVHVHLRWNDLSGVRASRQDHIIIINKYLIKNKTIKIKKKKYLKTL